MSLLFSSFFSLRSAAAGRERWHYGAEIASFNHLQRNLAQQIFACFLFKTLFHPLFDICHIFNIYSTDSMLFYFQFVFNGVNYYKNEYATMVLFADHRYVII